jgi:hypothetical protein
MPARAAPAAGRSTSGYPRTYDEIDQGCPRLSVVYDCGFRRQSYTLCASTNYSDASGRGSVSGTGHCWLTPVKEDARRFSRAERSIGSKASVHRFELRLRALPDCGRAFDAACIAG